MKKIVWITENFVDVDYPIIKEISDSFDIKWFISHRSHSEYYTQKETEEIGNVPNVDTQIFVNSHKYRSIFTAIHYYKLLKKAKKESPDIFYLDVTGAPFFHFIASIVLPKKKVIYAAHDVVEHVGSKYGVIMSLNKKIALHNYSYFQIFSDSQAEIFKEKYPDKIFFMARLALKDYGIPDSSITKQKDKITFLFFGSIRKNKGLSLFIDAVNNLNKKYPNRIHVIIAGQCDNWHEYEKLIEDPSVFEIQIALVPNSMIPNLFQRSHYIVLPYLDVTQSGVLAVAYQYEIPAIASDFPEFRNDIQEGETGYLCTPNDSSALTKKMEEVIQRHDLNYTQMTNNLSKYIQENISAKSIAAKYKTFFDSTFW